MDPDVEKTSGAAALAEPAPWSGIAPSTPALKPPIEGGALAGGASAGLVGDPDRSRSDLTSRHWHVLHTRSRQEKAVVRLLEAAGVERYLPLIERRRQWGGRRRRVSMPLFPGYVFARGPAESVYVALDSGRVVRRIPVPDQSRLEQELAQIRQALRCDGVFDPYPYLREGSAVRVRSGPLRGVEGLVDSRKRWDRLILQIEALGRAVSLEIDADLLEPVG